jgi:hypothetical protein
MRVRIALRSSWLAAWAAASLSAASRLAVGPLAWPKFSVREATMISLRASASWRAAVTTSGVVVLALRVASILDVSMLLMLSLWRPVILVLLEVKRMEGWKEKKIKINEKSLK